MIQGIVGNLSAAKTLSLTYIGLQAYARGAKIYSNYWLGFPHTMIRSLDDFETMRNGLLLADELWFWLDSYKSQDKAAQIITKILLSAGKRGVSVCWTAQHSSQIHRRVYNITSSFLLPVKHDAIDARTREKMLLNGKTFPATVDLYAADCFLTPYSCVTFAAPPIFKYYRTSEEIQPLEGLDYLNAGKLLKQHNQYEKAKKLGLVS